MAGGRFIDPVIWQRSALTIGLPVRPIRQYYCRPANHSERQGAREVALSGSAESVTLAGLSHLMGGNWYPEFQGLPVVLVLGCLAGS